MPDRGGELIGCGVVAEDFRPASLAAELNRRSNADIAALKARSHVAAQELCMEHNRDVVLGLVEEALGRG